MAVVIVFHIFAIVFHIQTIASAASVQSSKHSGQIFLSTTHPLLYSSFIKQETKKADGIERHGDKTAILYDILVETVSNLDHNNSKDSSSRESNVKLEETVHSWLEPKPLLRYHEVPKKDKRTVHKKRFHFVVRTLRDDGIRQTHWIPPDFILVVKLGVPVTELSLSSLEDLKKAFANVLNIPIDHAGIDKIRFQGNSIEMFFVRAEHENEEFGTTDLFLASSIISPDLLLKIQHEVSAINVTSIQTAKDLQEAILLAAYSNGSFWTKPYFPYIAAPCSVVIVLTVGIIIFCCCKKKASSIINYGPSNLASQQICLYPSATPDVKGPSLVQPAGAPVYVANGHLESIQARPTSLRKGLLQRRGSSASLTIDVTLSPELARWEGTPPKETSGIEYLLSAGNRLSRKDLRLCIKNPTALHEEFWEVPMNHPDKVQVAGSGTKNRYKTIIPNGHSRVLLPDSEGDPLSSYINANYIRGYEGSPKAFIATQGPMAHTVVDFWRTVWHEKAPVIAMITKLQENNKVKSENYLPEHHGQYGDVEVTVERVIEKNGFNVRYLTLKHLTDSFTVMHYWYTDWPDHKPPDSAKTLLEMVKEVELRRYQDDRRDKGPVIVHCSAGVGRTGCFVAISTGMKQLREEQSVDVLGILCAMRVDRGGMVQNNEQYSFIHQALGLYERELCEPAGISGSHTVD